MFRNSRNPSPQTIELLRQLAYISGGALCGVTALYLEECRRRIRILQGVLDKRRAIVQAAQARRYSKVALAARPDVADVEQVHALGYRPQSWEERKEAIGMRTRPPQEDDGHAIEASPDGLRSTTYSPFGPTSGSSEDRDDHRNFTPASNQHPSKASFKAYAPSVFAGISSLDSRESTIFHIGGPPALKQSKPDVVETRDTPQPPPYTRRHRVSSNRISTGARVLNTTRLVQSSSKGRLPFLTARPQSSRSQTVRRQIAALIEHSSDEQGGISVTASDALLPDALRSGTLKDIERLCDWMLRHGTFTIDHGRLLVESCPHLAKTSSPTDIFTLYASILNHKEFGIAELEGVFRLKVKFLTHALNWHASPNPTIYGNPILSNDMSWSLDSRTKTRILMEECRYLLSDAQTDRAADLFLIVARCSWRLKDSSFFLELSSLADEIMQPCQDEDLNSYRRLLHWKQSFQGPKELKQQFNTFVEACGRQRAFQVLAKFILPKKHGWSTSSLMSTADGLNKAILAVAFSVEVKLVTTFPEVYRQVPEQFQQYVDEFASAESLRVVWKAKQNLEMVGARAQELSTKLEKQGDEMTLVKVDEALLEIYISGRKYDKAFECIARMHKMRQGSAQFLALAAVYFANRWAWAGLTRLLEVSKSHGPFTFDEYSSKQFNNVIRSYAQAHSSLETWTFITNAIDELGFLPNFATVQSMLLKIVREKSIDLVPRWLRYMAAIGSSFDLNGHLAGAMIRHYYLWNRQPSDLLFQLCHRLTTSVPHFRAEHFKTTLKMVVGYDLRYGSGGGDGYMVQKEAVTLLEKLDAAKDVVPLPDMNEQQSHDLFHLPPLDHHTTDASQQTSQQSDERYYQTLALFNDEMNPVQEEQTVAVDPEVDVANELVEDPFRRRARDSRGQHESVAAKKSLRILEVDMTTALSLAQYHEVLDLYHGSCDAAGLPASQYSLKHAIDASIHLHQGDTSHAEKLIAKAKQSGMNVHRAMEPVLVHRSSNLTISDVREARRVCDATIEYYEENHRNGFPVKFALVHNVANTLIVRGHAEEALRLMSTIFQSDYIARIMPSIITLSVWLKAYAQLLSIEGIRWVAMRVLSENLAIDSIFLHDLENAARQPFHPAELKLIRSWLRMCEERRRQQDLEAKTFGNQLVDCIVGYVHQYAPVGRPSRPDDEVDQDVVDANVDRSSTASTAFGPNGLKKDDTHHKMHKSRRRRRSVSRAKAARPRSGEKLSIRMLAPSRHRSIVRKVTGPALDTPNSNIDLRPGS